MKELAAWCAKNSLIHLLLLYLSRILLSFVEQMQGLIIDAIRKLLPVNGQNRFVLALGPIITRLVLIFQVCQRDGHQKSILVFLDVKPVIFMVAVSETVQPETMTLPEQLALRLRLVDLGLAIHLHEATSTLFHGVHGTLAYSSLNQSEAQAPSGRRNLESLLYVIGEQHLVKAPYSHGTRSVIRKASTPLHW
jgi:hypothetical protein